VNTDGFEGNQVFVMWEWEWLKEADNDSESDQREDQNDTDSEVAASLDDNETDGNDIDEEEIPAITHSVTFKCIGSFNELRYQEVLAPEA